MEAIESLSIIQLVGHCLFDYNLCFVDSREMSAVLDPDATEPGIYAFDNGRIFSMSESSLSLNADG